MLDELRHFLLTVEHRTVTEAARLAHLSQPALSASLKRLEVHFGATLLHRGRRGVELTAAGRALLPRAHAVLAAFGDALSAVREVEGLQSGEVRIGAGGTVATYMLPQVLALYRKQNPKVRIVLSEMMPGQAREGVNRGELDIAIIDDALGEPWGCDAFVLVGDRRGAPAKQPFVTFLSGTSTRQALDDYFPGSEIVMELASIAAVKRHVRAGIGIALVSDAAVEVELANRRLYQLTHPLTPIRRDLFLVHRGRELLSPAAAALRALLLAHPPKARRTKSARRIKSERRR